MLFDVRSTLRSATGIAAVFAAVLLVSACGRRGPLEAPPDASVTAKPAAVKPATPARRVSAPPPPATFGAQEQQAQPQAATLDTPDDETEEADQSPADSIALTPTPTAPGTRKRNRAFHVPNEPFILDPLL
jgi:predicted small lipoprotein YifL